MDFDMPRSYKELLDRVNDFKDVRMPKAEAILQNFAFKSIVLHAQAPVFFIVDYVHKKYLYIDPTCKALLGYEVESLREAGPATYTSLWHKSDFKVFNVQIFPFEMNFLKKQPFASVQDYSFSFNYRIATKDGDFRTVLQRSTYYLTASDGTPLASVGFIIDISNFKEDTKIVFTIERIDRNYNSLTKAPLHKSVYFPEGKRGAQ